VQEAPNKPHGKRLGLKNKYKHKQKAPYMTYSSSLAMGRQRYAAQQQNTARVRATEKTLGPVSNTIMLIILACLLGLLYLTQVTKTNALSYKINDLKTQQTQLSTEHDDLQVSSARLQSLERVKNSDATRNLVSVSSSGTIQN
jgi:cell division protein FtsL